MSSSGSGTDHNILPNIDMDINNVIAATMNAAYR